VIGLPMGRARAPPQDHHTPPPGLPRPPNGISFVPRGVNLGAGHGEASVHLLPGRVGARGCAYERRGQGEVACGNRLRVRCME
jgi:hypothetical protein